MQETSYGKSIEISEQKMYQVGEHFNKHGREMGYLGKKEYYVCNLLSNSSEIIGVYTANDFLNHEIIYSKY